MADFKFGLIASNDLEIIKEDATFCASNGFDALEFNHWKAGIDKWSEDDAKTVRQILDDSGIKCCMMGMWGVNPLSEDAEEKAEALRLIEKSIEYAKILGAEIKVTGTGELKGRSLDENVTAFKEVMGPIHEKIKDAGFKHAIYPLHGGSFIHGTEGYEKLWEVYPELGVKFDPANWKHDGHDVIDSLYKLRDGVMHMHMKEHMYVNRRMINQPPVGMGDGEWGKIMALLYLADYDGYLVAEPHGKPWMTTEMRHKMALLSKRHVSQFVA